MLECLELVFTDLLSGWNHTWEEKGLCQRPLETADGAVVYTPVQTGKRGKQEGPVSCPHHLCELTKRKRNPLPEQVCWAHHIQSHACCPSRFACVLSIRACLPGHFCHVRTLWDPVDGSPSGSSLHGILQAGTLEWVAVPSSRGSSWPMIGPVSLTSPALAGPLPLAPPGKQSSATSRKTNLLQRKPLSIAFCSVHWGSLGCL